MVEAAASVRWGRSAERAKRAEPPQSVRVVSRADLAHLSCWATAFADCRKDNRFYELLEDTIVDGLDYGYFAICRGDGVVVAIQPFFLVDQDLLEGACARARTVVRSIRKRWPGFLKLRTLMVGCVAGEGHLADERTIDDTARALSDELTRRAKELGAELVVLKDREAIGAR
jgi:hypothetical protein